MNAATYLPAKKIQEKFAISSNGLRQLANAGKVEVKTTPGGKRYYNINTLFKDSDKNPELSEPEPKKKYVYCRVSSIKQTDDLERQKQFMSDKYPNHILLSDIGSGINYNRKNFTRILEDAINGDVEELVIAHKDRLSRFDFSLLEKIFSICKTKLVVLDKDDHKSSECELAEELLSIIHIFNCREMGKRRYKSKN